MATNSIGIRIADGSYYRVMEEGTPARKRLVLTTVQDNQRGAQIDLYRGNGGGIADAHYIGSLVIDEIEPATKGTPEIELIVGLDARGNLEAQASEKATGDRQTLSVALDSLGQGSEAESPEFGLDEDYQPELGVSPAEASSLTADTFPDIPRELSPETARLRRRRVLQYVGVGLAVLVVLLLILLLTLRITQAPKKAAPPKPAAVATAPQGASTAAPRTQASTPAAVSPSVPASGAASPKKPYPEGGVGYYIRWGDTLWDLSISFYRTPWLYGKIAKANDIKNPDLIFAHTEIYIPAR